MNRQKLRQRAMLILVTAIIYFLADYPVQLTHFLQFGPYIGIKNFLPTTLGLLFGPYGVFGALIGCTATSCLLSTPIMSMLLEWICIILPGVGVWILWHLVSHSHKIHFKSPVNYFRYLIIISALYTICGLLSYLFVEGGAFNEIMGAYISLSFLVGIPVNILFNGVLCLKPVLPPTDRFSPNAETIKLPANKETIQSMFEFLNAFVCKNAIDNSLEPNIQASLEEIFQRILKCSPTSDISLQISYDGIFSAVLKYDGPHINPLVLQKDEDEIDQAGLLLFMHRIQNIGYRHINNHNRVRFRLADGLSALLTKAPESLEQFNEQLEEYAISQKVAKKIGRKQLFGLQNCLEELYIRICGASPDVKMTINVTYDDTFSIRIAYLGKKYNPLLIGEDEDEMDIASLKLIKHRALRASYKYKYEENIVHIVI
ncbi:MAG: hypothetical protein IKP58_02545 [Victivallales bacterium]|nr:hypothetical protein [Victivallales bacterium]